MDLLRKIDWVVLFVFVCECYRLSAGLQCYVGVVHKAKGNESNDQLASVDCSVNNQDGSTAGPLVNATASGSAVNSSSRASTNCIIFYDPVADVAKFACDQDNACANKQGSHQFSVCFRQKMGSLYCCQEDLCNAALHLHHMNPPQASTLCYSGVNNGSGTPTITEVVCRTSWCYQESTFAGGHLVKQTFGCRSQCDSNQPSKPSCEESHSPDGTRRRICFCSSDRCNTNVGVVTAVDENGSPRPLSTTPRLPLLSMPNPSYGKKNQQSSRQLWTKAAVGSSTAVVILLLIILVALVVYRFKQHRAKTVTFTYTQLTADLTESPDGTDDDKLLVG